MVAVTGLVSFAVWWVNQGGENDIGQQLFAWLVCILLVWVAIMVSVAAILRRRNAKNKTI